MICGFGLDLIVLLNFLLKQNWRNNLHEWRTRIEVTACVLLLDFRVFFFSLFSCVPVFDQEILGWSQSSFIMRNSRFDFLRKSKIKNCSKCPKLV